MVRPKKHLGQHFLHDATIARRIVDLLQAKATDRVVEIGPGRGILTQFLLPTYPELLLIEIDPEAIDFLKLHFQASSPQILGKDVLEWDMNSISPDTFFISNLPYNISSPVFFKFLDHLPYIRQGVFMIQKEVAERICAPPGNKEYGILSVLLGAYFKLEYTFSVSPGAFFPPPKVMSAVIRMTRKDEVLPVTYPQLKQVVKSAFGQRRKTLRNALKGLPLNNGESIKETLDRRAEQLSVKEFVSLTQLIFPA